MLLRKYADDIYEELKAKGKDALSIWVIRNKNSDDNDIKWNEAFGSIDLFVERDGDLIRYPYHYNLYIDYIDQINSDKHEDKVLDEL